MFSWFCKLFSKSAVKVEEDCKDECVVKDSEKASACEGVVKAETDTVEVAEVGDVKGVDVIGEVAKASVGKVGASVGAEKTCATSVGNDKDKALRKAIDEICKAKCLADGKKATAKNKAEVVVKISDVAEYNKQHGLPCSIKTIRRMVDGSVGYKRENGVISKK